MGKIKIDSTPQYREKVENIMMDHLRQKLWGKNWTFGVGSSARPEKSPWPSEDTLCMLKGGRNVKQLKSKISRL